MPIKNLTLQKEAGLTLIELMISIALGLIVLTALVYMLSATMRTNADTLRTTHLNQDLRAVIQMMVRDIKRAGYGAKAENIALCASATPLTLSATSGTITISKTNGNKACDDLPVAVGSVFMNIANVTGTLVAACTTVTATGWPVTTSGSVCPGAGSAVNFSSTTVDAGTWTIINPFHSITAEDVASDADTGDDCILFSYDVDDDGNVDTNERYGFRFNASEGSIETGSSVTSCTAGTWENLTEDSGIQITNLDITATSATNSSADVDVCVREIQIALTGRLVNDSNVTRTINESVKTRNDLIIESACPAI
jgi:type II secretory pathway component PulJ